MSASALDALDALDALGDLGDLVRRIEVAESARLARLGRYAEADAALAAARETPAGLDLRARIAAQQSRVAEAVALWREAAARLGTPGAFDDEIAAVTRWSGMRRPARRIAGFAAPVALGLALGGWVGAGWSSPSSDELEELRADMHDALTGLESQAVPPAPDERVPEVEPLRDRLAAIAGLEVRRDRSALRVRFAEPAFGEGVALAPTGRAALAAIGAAVAPDARRHLVVVTGHTDPRPMRPGGRFADNEDLALARARAGADALAAGGLPAESIAMTASTAGPRERTLTLTITDRGASPSSRSAIRGA